MTTSDVTAGRTGGVVEAVWFVANASHRAGPYVLIEMSEGKKRYRRVYLFNDSCGWTERRPAGAVRLS